MLQIIHFKSPFCGHVRCCPTVWADFIFKCRIWRYSMKKRRHLVITFQIAAVFTLPPPTDFASELQCSQTATSCLIQIPFQQPAVALMTTRFQMAGLESYFHLMLCLLLDHWLHSIYELLFTWMYCHPAGLPTLVYFAMCHIQRIQNPNYLVLINHCCRNGNTLMESQYTSDA